MNARLQCDSPLGLNLRPLALTMIEMSRSRSTALIWLVCVALLVMRIGTVHVHFCADGSEPAASLHIGDDGIHDLDHPRGDTTDTRSTDTDVSVAGDALLKNLAGDVDLPAITIAAAILLFVVTVSRSLVPRFEPPLVRIADPFRLHPPLRGPPV